MYKTMYNLILRDDLLILMIKFEFTGVINVTNVKCNNISIYANAILNISMYNL